MSQVQSPAPEDIRPAVAGPVSNKSVWIFAGAALILGGGLFMGLEARRAAQTAPLGAVAPSAGEGMIAAPPMLDIPPEQVALSPVGGPLASLVPLPSAAGFAPAPQQAARSIPSYQPAYSAPPQYTMPPVQPLPQQAGPALVYQAPMQTKAQSGSDRKSAEVGERAEASMFVNPSTTVPQGAVIQAVLETAIDSNHGGPARAIVSLDVRSFDGTRILIPRGSRLFGTYKSDINAGQNRAMVQWTRLMRPDGAIIELDSPSADPLGRAGVKGKVNSHFFTRFGGTILQSFLDTGVALATQKVSNGTVVVGLPGSTQSLVTPSPESVRPTLTVAQGTPVSVFVTRDLDFSKVER